MKTLAGRIASIQTIEPDSKFIPQIAVLTVLDREDHTRVAYAPAQTLREAVNLMFGDHPEGHEVSLRLDGHAIMSLEPVRGAAL